MPNPQRSVPATPGYHSAPSAAPAHRAVPGVPATPGFHARQSGGPHQEPDTPKSTEDSAASTRPKLGNLLSKLSDQIQALVKGEIELAKVKATNMAKRSGMGIALLVVAGVLALYMLGYLFGAAASALALVVPLWAAKLIVAGILLVVLLILALVGKASLQKGISDKPAPQEGIKESIAAVKKGLE